ncbi:uncharacterized protein LOC135500728 [Lineus longissimus]|uniref:uncharacterized protein LOC135500728 n=1 Tax=Lineus longissimus TaxID=88925 RepID=UPI00315D361E
MSLEYYLLTIIQCMWILTGCHSKSCVTDGPCSCTYDDGSGTVDISSVGNTDGTPRLKDKLADDGVYLYSYNPCRPFSEGDKCTNVAVCEVLDNDGTFYYTPAGAQDGAQFGTEGSDLKVTYKSSPDQFSYITNVILKCDETVTGDPTWQVPGTQPDFSIKLVMTHKCNCPGHCGSEGPHTGGLSVGSILCIIFFAGIAVYFAFGAVYMFFIKKESGKQVVPNVTFWTGLPGYIKDGGQLVVGKVTGKGGYSQI